jgi:chromosome segregation ATPase
MSIDGKSPSPSRQAQDRISALVSENGRLRGRIEELTAQRDAAQDDRDEKARERDRARALAVDFEQQLDQIRAGLVAAAGEVRSFPERSTSEWVKGQYAELIDQLAIVLEVTGEHYPERSDSDAAEELAQAWEGDRLAGQMLPEALDLDDEAREEARLDEVRTIAGCSG